MALKDRIKRDTADAMRARDPVRLSALRMLSAAIQRREVDERITLDDSQVMAAIEKLIKQSRESIEQYEKGAR
ncbi:MAG: GatB/YqeY domain-containing protein, partial [Gammaproteobacteria bacterium]|nr:GatB/YqeY domain-containing protein [Gammaproteobacteria bacterium]